MAKKHSIPGQIAEYLRTKHKSPQIDEIQLFFRPLKDDKNNVTDWVLVGKNICSKGTCEYMFGSCSSCRLNAVKDAEKRLAESELEKKAKSSGLVLAKNNLILPKGLDVSE